MTYAQLVNAVLRRLREDEVSIYNETEYSTLIGDFVNQVKQEVEDAWDWSQLRQTVNFTTVSGTNIYTMDGVTSDIAMGERFKIFNMIDDENDTEIFPIDYAWLKRQNLQGTQQNSQSYRYMIEGATSGNPNIQLYPIPDGAYEIYIHTKIPQDDFTTDGDILKVPSLPVILGTYALALAERGEEGSTSFEKADMKYHNALADSISMDAINFPRETMWFPE